MLFVQAWDNYGSAPAGWGSHIMVAWRDFEPAPGVYRPEIFTTAIARRDRPCYVQLYFSLYDQVARAPADFTPRHYKRSIKLTAGSLHGEIPPYDGTWTAAYCCAVEALAEALRAHPQVVGYWHAAGWNTETQAAQLSAQAWGTAVKPLLSQSLYYEFITASTQRALAAWGPLPVYLPGAPAPGAVWGTKRRDVIADLLRQGCGYLNCGLRTDNDTSIEVGERAGLGMYDIGALTQRRGFEEGERQDRNDPMELYWMLLRSRHWQADFVNLYASLSAPQVAQVAALLPADATRWIVFRAAEYPLQTWHVGTRVYGQGGEPGFWAQGITAPALSLPARESQGFGYNRWVLTVDGLLALRLPGAADGAYTVTFWRPDGSQEQSVREVAGERLVLPAGRYHRVDVAPALLTIDERVATLEARVAALEHSVGEE